MPDIGPLTYTITVPAAKEWVGENDHSAAPVLYGQCTYRLHWTVGHAFAQPDGNTDPPAWWGDNCKSVDWWRVDGSDALVSRTPVGRCCPGTFFPGTCPVGQIDGLEADYFVDLAEGLTGTYDSKLHLQAHTRQNSTGSSLTLEITYLSGPDPRFVFVPDPDPPPEPPVVFEVCDVEGANCVEFTGLTEKKVRAVLNEPGEFSFAINRYDAQVTAARLQRGNIVRATFTEIDPDPIFEGILEEGDFDLISSDEEGGEELRFGGPGSFRYLGNARLGPENLQYPFGAYPSEGVWRWTNEQAGSIIRRMLDEAQLHTPNPLPLLTRTFDDVNDSNGVPWEDLDGDWEDTIGSPLDAAVARLVDAGRLYARMDPGLVLSLYQTWGRDLTGAFGTDTVRFEKGVNIASELTRQMLGREWYSHVLVQTKSDYLWVAALSYPYVREGFLDLTNASDSAVATRAAEHRMLRGDEVQDQLTLEVAPYGQAREPNQPELGWYYPGPDWSEHGKFWLGDLVTVHTGTDPFDYDEETFRVYAVTLQEDETGALAVPVVELNSPDRPPSEPLETAASGRDGSSSSTGAPAKIHRHSHHALADNGDGDDHPQYLLEAVIDAAGDLLVGTADNTAGRLAKGTDGQVLTVDPGTHLLAWATAASALTVQEADGAPTDAAVTKLIFPNGTLSFAGHEATYTPSAAPTGAAASVAAKVFAYLSFR